MCGVLSLDMDEIGWCCKLGLGKIVGLPQHNLFHFVKVLGGMGLFWFVFFWSLWGSDGGYMLGMAS